ncbi:hypothetical protein GCM10011316_14150 [Roseibium aquae]|uniref:DUF1176 domain-containing protein n=1 Tax=Roseibium aquae TaxID=1323746 RepID=A0A916WZR5_9HYPH|nr:hypothetical protein [Roseibium aquae]GGB43326.1 hypothetical protein GCM10011316_14150 [Roseibium aquae]
MRAPPLAIAVLFAAGVSIPTGSPSASEAGPVYDVDRLPEIVRQIATGEFQCDLAGSIEAFGYVAVSTDRGSTLFAVPCFPADVNLESLLVEIESDGTAWLHSLAESPEGGRLERVTNPVILDRGTRLTTASFYGPDGDCGLFTSYRHDPDRGGYLIVEQREKPDCGGDYAPPETYPVIWSLN